MCIDFYPLYYLSGTHGRDATDGLIVCHVALIKFELLAALSTPPHRSMAVSQADGWTWHNNTHYQPDKPKADVVSTSGGLLEGENEIPPIYQLAAHVINVVL